MGGTGESPAIKHALKWSVRQPRMPHVMHKVSRNAIKSSPVKLQDIELKVKATQPMRAPREPHIDWGITWRTTQLFVSAIQVPFRPSLTAALGPLSRASVAGPAANVDVRRRGAISLLEVTQRFLIHLPPSPARPLVPTPASLPMLPFTKIWRTTLAPKSVTRNPPEPSPATLVGFVKRALEAGPAQPKCHQLYARKLRLIAKLLLTAVSCWRILARCSPGYGYIAP